MTTEIKLDLSVLKGALTPAENPGLDTLDPRFQDLAGLVEAGETAKAAEMVEGLIKENLLDIRIVGYYLFGAFNERGLAGFDEVLEVTKLLLGDNWPAFGPLKKKEMHAEKGLTWFFNRLEKKLSFEEEKKQDEWNNWLAAVNGDAVNALVARLEEVKTAALAKMPAAAKLGDAIKKVADWLKTFEKLVHVDAPPPPPPEAEKPKEEAPKAEKAAKGAAAAAPAAMAGDVVISQRPMIEGSHHLQDLLDRLKAFESLCQKKDFDKASLAALELQNTIEHFDPRLYFPKLFASYYRLMSQHVEALAPMWESKESLPWKAKEQLFRVDLDAFVGGR
jgi:hypothetical protein